MKFLTGCDRAPVRGLGDIKMVITKHGDGNLLPASHTCFNHLLLPEYKTYEDMKKKVLIAIEHNQGFGMF